MITNFLLQMFFLFGFIVIFGLIVAVSNHLFEKFLAGGKIYKVSAYLGTPVHEAGHAIMCLLFGHKIVEAKFFPTFNSKDGTLGYVSHKYNKKNYYQVVGNFFIAVGPIIFGSLLLFLGMFILLPNCLDVLLTSADKYLLISDKTFIKIFEGTFRVFGDVMVEMGKSYDHAGLYIYLLLGLLLSLHFDLSTEDIKGGVIGLVSSALVVFVINAIIYIFSRPLSNNLTYGCLVIGTYLLIILVVCLIFCVINVGISAILYLCYYKRKKKQVG